MTPAEWTDIGTFSPLVSDEIRHEFNLPGPKLMTPTTPAPVPTLAEKTVTDQILIGLQYAPYVLTAVQGIQATNASLPGATKKEIVLASIQAAAKVGATVPESHVQIISSLVDLIAGILFKPKPAAAPVTAGILKIPA